MCLDIFRKYREIPIPWENPETYLQGCYMPKTNLTYWDYVEGTTLLSFKNTHNFKMESISIMYHQANRTIKLINDVLHGATANKTDWTTPTWLILTINWDTPNINTLYAWSLPWYYDGGHGLWCIVPNTFRRYPKPASGFQSAAI